LSGAAIALPTLIAFNVPPSATFFNQAAALVGWGAWLTWLMASIERQRGHAGSGLVALQAAFGLMLVASLAAPLWAGLPGSLALSSAGMILAAGLVTWGAATLQRAGCGLATFRTFCVALTGAAVASAAIGLIQVFAPALADGDWIARTSLAGRAVGNMRQPNHLSSLLLWGVIASVWLAEAGVLRRVWAGLATLLLVFVLVLSGSRTGALGTAGLALWGLLDRRLSRPARWLLCLAPLTYALFWLGMSAWADVSHHVFGAETRFSTSGDVSSSRFAIWSNTLALIREHLWSGVGFGEFNFAWTLTPFPGRPVAFFDHTHNLALHLAVELGIPLTLVVAALLGWSFVCAFRLASGTGPADGDPGSAPNQRAALMMVLMVMLHSLLEYPLWYAYFLLPTAFAFGLCLAEPAGPGASSPALPTGRTARTRPLVIASMVMTFGGMFALYDYLRVVVIFAPPAGAAPLSDRIADGRRSVLFSHHAAYAAATTAEHPSDAMWAFNAAPHYLLDARLMQAWAVALMNPAIPIAPVTWRTTEGIQEAISRRRSSRCATKQRNPGRSRPFQCDPPSRSYTYLDFR
jgi:hypothetical protein